MTHWELARYLMDAKKSVDSMLYIAEVLPELQYIQVRPYVNANRQTFYICCCVLLDSALSGRAAKKELRAKDAVAEAVYYQRDKNYAHKDADYQPVEYTTLAEMASEMQAQLLHIQTLCGDKLPPEVTLDFVPYDRVLFRMVSGITKAIEDKINDMRYPKRAEAPFAGVAYPVFNDTEDLKGISTEDRAKYAVDMQQGLNTYESLQNFQDSCVRINVLHGLKMWCRITKESLENLQKASDEVFTALGLEPRFPVGRTVFEIELGGIDL